MKSPTKREVVAACAKSKLPAFIEIKVYNANGHCEFHGHGPDTEARAIKALNFATTERRKALAKKPKRKPVSHLTVSERRAIFRMGALAGKLRPVNRAGGAPDATPNAHLPKLPKGWTYHTRETGLIEATCSHGVGHPVPDKYQPKHAKGKDGMHGCDGCCSGVLEKL